MIFFIPRPEFLTWLRDHVRGRLVVDCGAGAGRFARLAKACGISVLSIDILPDHECGESTILCQDATVFNYPRNAVAVIARPCRGQWIEDTIRRALETCAYVLYIGIPEHLSEDVEELQGVDVELVYRDAGEDHELVYEISREETVSKLKLDYYLVTCYNGADRTYPSTSWYAKGNGRWINYNGGWRPISAHDKVLRTQAAEDVHELDWMITDLIDNDLTSGWLDREGKFLGCRSMAHDSVADLVFNKSIGEMEDAGFVRIYGPGEWACTKHMSPEQRNYMLVHGFDIAADGAQDEEVP